MQTLNWNSFDKDACYKGFSYAYCESFTIFSSPLNFPVSSQQIIMFQYP